MQVFEGNSDYGTMRTNMFNPPIMAQFIRIYPVMCRRACTLRFELIGCEMNGKCPLPGAAGQGVTWGRASPLGLLLILIPRDKGFVAACFSSH